MILGFAISIFVARALGAEGKGEVAYFMLVFGIIVKFGHLGINESLPYFIKKTKYDNDSVINNNFSFTLGLCLIYFLIILALSKFGIIFNHFSIFVLIMGMSYVLFSYLESNLKMITVINEKFYIYNKYKVIAISLKLLLVLVLWLFGRLTISNYIFLNISIFFIPVILMQIYFKFRFRLSIDFNIIQKQLAYGMKFFLSTFFIYMTYKVDQIFIKNYLDITNLGVYSIGVTLSELVFLIPHSITNPLRGKLYNTSINNLDKKKTTIKTTKYTIYISLFIAIIGFLLAPLIPFVYGPEFVDSIPVVRILFIGVVFATIGKVSSSYFFTEGKPEVHLKITFLAFLSNIILNIILIPKFGINGAAISSTISYAIFGFSYILVLLRDKGINFSDFFVIKKSELKSIVDFIKRRNKL